MLCETPELSFCFRSWGRGKGWEGNWKSFLFFRIRAAWLQSTCGLAGRSQSVIQKPAAPAAHHTQAVPWDRTRDTKAECPGARAGAGPQAGSPRAQPTQCLHVTHGPPPSCTLPCWVLMLGCRCKAKSATGGGELDLANAKHLLHPNAFLLP